MLLSFFHCKYFAKTLQFMFELDLNQVMENGVSEGGISVILFDCVWSVFWRCLKCYLKMFEVLSEDKKSVLLYRPELPEVFSRLSGANSSFWLLRLLKQSFIVA